jgi:hypothetical protein
MTHQEPDDESRHNMLRGSTVLRSDVAMSEPDGFVDPKTIGLHDDGIVALLVRAQVTDQPGVLHALTRTIVIGRS